MSDRGWSLTRAVLLALAAVVLSPLSPLVLVAVTASVLLLAFRPSDLRAGIVAVLLLVLAFSGSAEARDSLWFVERGWALLAGGAFVAATLWRGGEESLTFRGLLAVTGGLLGSAAASLVQPELPLRVEHAVSVEMERAATSAYQVVGSLGGGMSPELEWAMFDWVEFQASVYPAMLALATLAALAVGWYVVRRLAGASRALPPFTEFRFNDHLVWILVAGLVLLVLPWGGAWSRAGENAVLFMGGMYLLRGAGVLAWIAAASLSSVWSLGLWAAVALLLYPLAAGTAVLVGLCDTWVDIRERIRPSSA